MMLPSLTGLSLGDLMLASLISQLPARPGCEDQGGDKDEVPTPHSSQSRSYVKTVKTTLSSRTSKHLATTSLPEHCD